MIERTWTSIEYAEHETKLKWSSKLATQTQLLVFSLSLAFPRILRMTEKIDKFCNKFQSIYQVRTVENKCGNMRRESSGEKGKEKFHALKIFEATMAMFRGCISDTRNDFAGFYFGLDLYLRSANLPIRVVMTIFSHHSSHLLRNKVLRGNMEGRWISSVYSYSLISRWTSNHFFP